MAGFGMGNIIGMGPNYLTRPMLWTWEEKPDAIVALPERQSRVASA